MPKTNRGSNLGTWLHPKKSGGKKTVSRETKALVPKPNPIMIGAMDVGEPKKNSRKQK